MKSQHIISEMQNSGKKKKKQQKKPGLYFSQKKKPLFATVRVKAENIIL